MHPQPHVTLHLEPSITACFTTGDHIQGTVKIHPKARPQKVKIVLRGLTKTRIVAHNSEYRTFYEETIALVLRDVPLFTSSSQSQSYEILYAPGGVRDDGYVWLPFEFTMPGHVELDCASFMRELENPVFEDGPGHVLPPSFSHDADNFVDYWVEAMVFEESPDEPKHCPRKGIRFMPPSKNMAMADIVAAGIFVKSVGTGSGKLKNVQFSTHRLHPNYDPNEGLLSRIKHAVKKGSSTPFAAFRVDASVPSTLYVDQSIPVSFSLAHKERSDVISEAPDLYITKIRVELESILKIRVPLITMGIDITEKDEIHSVKSILLDRDFGSPGKLLHDGLTMEELLGSEGSGVRIGPQTTPSFRSYLLNLSYQLGVYITLQCASEKFEHVPCKGSVEVLSGVDGKLEEDALESLYR